jgi:ribonuclease-3
LIGRKDKEKLEAILRHYFEKIEKLEEILGRRFRNRYILLIACIHASFSNENALFVNNEKLEFLGDSVLSLIISEFLLKKSADESEGELAKLKSYLASEENLAHSAENLGLESFLLLGKGASKENLGKRSNLADFTEALIGALYLDGGLSAAKSFVLEKLLVHADPIDYARHDPKSVLQEKLLMLKGVLPSYRVLSTEGPPHQRVFRCGVFLRNELIAEGNGRSKKEAEKEAAFNALKKLGFIDYE